MVDPRFTVTQGQGDGHRIGAGGWLGALCTRTCLSGNHFTAISIPYLVPLLIGEIFFKLSVYDRARGIHSDVMRDSGNTLLIIYQVTAHWHVG